MSSNSRDRRLFSVTIHREFRPYLHFRASIPDIELSFFFFYF